MAAVDMATASPHSCQNVDPQTGRGILVENSSNVTLPSPKRAGSSAHSASPKSPLASRKMVLHPELFKVVKGNEDFSAKLIATAKFQAGQTLCKITGITKGATKRYTTVQSGVNEHFELNSDLVFMNHSCSPNINVDVEKMEIIALKDIAAGDELTFFYCSTEYDMDQPFQCWCGYSQCIGWIGGAKYLSPAQLGRYQVNKHIQQLVYRSLIQQ